MQMKRGVTKQTKVSSCVQGVLREYQSRSVTLTCVDRCQDQVRRALREAWHKSLKHWDIDCE